MHRFALLAIALLAAAPAFAGDTMVPQSLRYNGAWYFNVDSEEDGQGNTLTLFQGGNGSIILNQTGNDDHSATFVDGNESRDVSDDVVEADRDDPEEENSVPNGPNPTEV